MSNGSFFVYRYIPIGYVCNQEQGRKDQPEKSTKEKENEEI